MTETDALLEACRLRPGEDTPRLMLADKLEETGRSEAAQYIRESIHFAQTGKMCGAARKRFRYKTGVPYSQWLESLFGIEGDFEKGYTDRFICAGETWDNFHLRLGDKRNCNFTVRRGLPEEIGVTAPLLMEQAPSLFRFPLTKCVVKDRSPFHCPDTGRWIWMAIVYPQVFNTWEDEPHHIPIQLPMRGAWLSHRTKAAALSALHAAAYQFGIASIGQPVT